MVLKTRLRARWVYLLLELECILQHHTVDFIEEVIERGFGALYKHHIDRFDLIT